MKTLTNQEADFLFDKYWNEMTEEWFKVEILQDYTGEDDGPSLQSWASSDKKLSIELMKKNTSTEWVKECEEKIKDGVKLIRIHVVEEPYSPYIEWELEHYKEINIKKCGEKIFLVNKVDTADLQLPRGDMMIFDNRRVVVNSYDSSGKVVEQGFYEETDDISQFLKLKQQLQNIAKPFAA